ncbi:MAG: phospholipase, patatin family protein [Candidatus Nomurabacteria bacterium GW2011_GWE1_32_28]|uniref:Phospholipase, patatin family protein n=1 Tax=Candidatus Nomurabacteria bacterium GW2011_GWF1_31_48 TaxID=1618767 RepID=A0A0F9YUP7_9BACT|nr:MAG: phospholipase, patatin family protein [Candidatus Nomurabacteria bacterium GW2011_GWF2_30_133]KKP28635.1 MAG: phospholipase, patatin family protein [Candidatus Nomurabacteria bacterium GW2011_GWE2_31_40]KKP30211.1 MAG: phospholipase, patatin family protein [Candidatus Nomurabacteria bacterium GW2011_GWF1_31_48]KKP34737.1 MAG: phospholipase, patatin family protein [Candidatus Nomurabacteria bacterium GW2011_GWE1_32_28]HAS80805.1 esterase [Candidatus Nomurabacteria bacterium]
MEKQRKKVGLVLGSGGVRGFAHIGVIKKLLEHNIPIDYIAGSSIGAWVGAYYSLFKDVKNLEEYTLEKKREKFMSFLEPTFSGGLIKGDKLEKLLNGWLNDADFKDLKIPLAIVATDLVTGEAVVFKKGKLATAVRASISVPTLFTPVRIDNKILVDGGLSNPVPDDVVRKMGADIVISVNLDNYVKNEEFLTDKNKSLSNTAIRSINILRYHLSRYSTSSSDFVIEPYTPNIGIKSFRDYFRSNIATDLVKNGEIETEKIIKELKAVL